MKSPLRWVGGKQAEADYLASLLPQHSCYVEVFGGGGSVLLAKRPSEVEVYNDLNGELVNFFRVVKERPDEFKNAWKWCLVSREEFTTLQDAPVNNLDPIERAYRFLYLNKTCFGGDMCGRMPFGINTRDQSLLVGSVKSMNNWLPAIHARLKTCWIENLPWKELVPRLDGIKPGPRGTVFFCDPPYLGTHGYDAGEFGEADHKELAEALGGLKWRFLVTINDHPVIRDLYDGCYITGRTKQYSVGSSVESRRDYAELIISNYPLPTQKQPNFDFSLDQAPTQDPIEG